MTDEAAKIVYGGGGDGSFEVGEARGGHLNVAQVFDKVDDEVNQSFKSSGRPLKRPRPPQGI